MVGKLDLHKKHLKKQSKMSRQAHFCSVLQSLPCVKGGGLPKGKTEGLSSNPLSLVSLDSSPWFIQGEPIKINLLVAFPQPFRKVGGLDYEDQHDRFNKNHNSSLQHSPINCWENRHTVLPM